MQAQEGFAAVNGTRLYYELAGAGAPLVLIHGFTLDTRMWDDQFAPLAAQHRVLRYDARGFGKSAPTGEAEYAHTDDLAALLAYLGIDRAAVVGLSMGGGIAIDFALAYPAMVAALVPVDAALGGYPWSEEFNRQLGTVWQTARAAGGDAGKALWLDLPLFTPAREQPAVGARLAAMVADYSGRHWLHGDPQRGSEPPASERLAAIAAPTLAIIGARDIPDFQAMTDRIAAGIPGARKAPLSGAGHMANMEAPAAFTEVLLTFLSAA
jgi:pimeloyl-ACP methyl ester carboxylesterase